MKSHLAGCRLTVALIVQALLLPFLLPSHAQTGPQDNWAAGVDQRIGNVTPGTPSAADGFFNGPWGIAVDTNALYVADGWNNRVQILSKDGAYLGKITSVGGGGVQFSRLRGLAADADHLYTTDILLHEVQKITKSGTLVWRRGSGGSATNQFNAPNGVAVDDTHVYVADSSNHRVVKYTKAGVYVKHWGTQGSVAGQFNTPYGVAVDIRHVYVVELYNGGRLQVFDTEGNYIRGWALPRGGSTSGTAINCMGVAVDGRNVYVTIGGLDCAGCGSFRHALVYDKMGNLQGSLAQNPLSFPTAIAVDNPFLYVSDFGAHQVLPFQRVFRSLGPLVPNAIPLAEALSVQQRPGTAVVDVDIRSEDPDDSHLRLYALAFVSTNTVPTLNELVPIRTLVEGTAANVGTNVLAGVTRRLSWDMEADNVADRIGDSGNLKFAILARDGRGLIDLHFLSLPAIGAHPPLTINRTPLYDSDFLPVWFWLVASNDPGVEFFEGKIYAAASARSLLFAQGNTTTPEGRSYLFARMNVREASVDEMTHAREATTPGLVTERDPRRQPPPAGYKVNEFNFVTSPNTGFRVVPLQP